MPESYTVISSVHDVAKLVAANTLEQRKSTDAIIKAVSFVGMLSAIAAGWCLGDLVRGYLG
jgi:hypothetical protein